MNENVKICSECGEKGKDRKYLCHDIKTPDGLAVRCAHRGSKKKVDALYYYLKIFSVAMRYSYSNLCFIDLFSGSGLCYDRNCTDGEDFFDGSSLQALKVEHPFTRYIFVDNNPKSAIALKERVDNKFPELSSRVITLECDANSQIDMVLSHVKKQSSITVVFIDPNGIDIHFDTIKKLSEQKHLDLIIHFSISDLKRNFELYRDGNEKADRFFGTKNWPKSWAKDSPEWLPFYKKKLAGLGFVGLEGRDERHITVFTPSNVPIYYLIYASKDDLGLRFWRETKRYIEEPDLIR